MAVKNVVKQDWIKEGQGSQAPGLLVLGEPPRLKMKTCIPTVKGSGGDRVCGVPLQQMNLPPPPFKKRNKQNLKKKYN